MKISNYWYVRLLTQHEVRPVFAALMAGFALLLTFVIWAVIFKWLGGDVHFTVSNIIYEVLSIAVVGYFIGGTLYTLKMTPRDVLALAPALALDEKSLDREAATITEQSSAIHVWTLCWMLLMIILTWWISQMASEDIASARQLSQPTFAGWPYFRNLIYAFTLSQFIWIDIALARRLGKLLEEHGRVNLLDRSSLRALAKRTRRSVLVWIPVLCHSIIFIGILLAVVILPTTGIRRRYAEEKSQQLEKVRARIADRSAAVVDGTSTSELSNLPELVSWEQRLQQARVWPYEMTIYLRVFLYAGIGLSSWVGAALVERSIGAFFG
ncbi:MAG: hypothetical protein ACI9UU_000020 [Candidatus Azotimanducaceae bacterium]|jgi:hypothetical protein